MKSVSSIGVPSLGILEANSLFSMLKDRVWHATQTILDTRCGKSNTVGPVSLTVREGVRGYARDSGSRAFPSRDGSELCYRNKNIPTLMAVPVQSEPTRSREDDFVRSADFGCIRMPLAAGKMGPARQDRRHRVPPRCLLSECHLPRPPKRRIEKAQI